ncbi:GerAB/ArcD/ProY family transporter [uncultured Metabacillus sp.]|uniref:GerAB/ArcD/ProY family transporter n=1 Tax=uncultured Metabacillus sp. TaxID=2860135 RepID=UPI0026335E2E|nr:GerAB/ArcD/ProY family transporter [uncultured Metabacillus sp.]
MVILVAALSSLVLVGIYIKLAALHPEFTLIQALPFIVGKFISYPLIIIYIVYFIYLAARVCRNLGELLLSTILVKTPILVVIGIFVMLIVYCLRGGIEALGRMGLMAIVFPFVLLCIGQIKEFMERKPL